jgi:hypothetical protein
MASEKQTYTAEQTQLITQGYLGGKTVESLALEVGKSVRSVVAKLAQVGVYKARETQAKTRVTKETLVNQIASRTEIDRVTLQSLEKCDKAALQALADYFQ